MKQHSKSHKQLKKQKQLALIGGLFAVICLVVVGVIAYRNNQKIANFAELSPQVQQIFAEDPDTTPSATEIKKRYEKLKPIAKTCKTQPGGLLAGSTDQSNLDLLFFYREMAIASYSFGDRDDAEVYADKASEFNSKVSDAKRGDKTKVNQVKSEMEAIKNGVY
jgi:hypothetical protein